MTGKLLTIRECAELGIANENFIRSLVRENQCPGIRHGNRFYVNVDLLKELLDNLSREEVKNERQNK